MASEAKVCSWCMPCCMIAFLQIILLIVFVSQKHSQKCLQQQIIILCQDPRKQTHAGHGALPLSLSQ